MAEASRSIKPVTTYAKGEIRKTSNPKLYENTLNVFL